MPNDPLWSLPGLTFGPSDAPTVYYRLSPALLHWLTTAGRALEVEHLAGKLDRNQLDVYLDAMHQVTTFAAAHLRPDAVERAKTQRPELPDAPAPK